MTHEMTYYECRENESQANTCSNTKEVSIHRAKVKFISFIADPCKDEHDDDRDQLDDPEDALEGAEVVVPAPHRPGQVPGAGGASHRAALLNTHIVAGLGYCLARHGYLLWTESKQNDRILLSFKINRRMSFPRVHSGLNDSAGLVWWKLPKAAHTPAFQAPDRNYPLISTQQLLSLPMM